MEMVKDTFTEDEVDEAKNASFSEGYDSGYEDGLAEGRDEGESSGYDSGYEDGKNDAYTFEYEKDQLYDLIVGDLQTEVENELYLMRELRQANPDLQKLYDRIVKIIRDAENV